MKSTAFHWKQQDFIMDFTVDSISVLSVMKSIMKSVNEINSEIHYEILLIWVKSVDFNEILWNAVDFMKSCDILGISWNPIAFNKVLLDLMDLIICVEFHEIMWNPVEFYEILSNHVVHLVQIWWTSGGFEIMQILFQFTTDFNVNYIMDFICVFYAFHMKSTWFHIKDQEKVKNLIWISCSYWFQVDFMWFHVESARFHVISCEICGISCEIPRFHEI